MTIETLPHVCVVVVFLSVAIRRAKYSEIPQSAVLARQRWFAVCHKGRDSMKLVENLLDLA
jgi:hypothetical protein